MKNLIDRIEKAAIQTSAIMKRDSGKVRDTIAFEQSFTNQTLILDALKVLLQSYRAGVLVMCEDCIKHSDHGIIQFCYTHQNAKAMRQILEEFSIAMDGKYNWIIFGELQKRADAIIHKV